MKAPAVDRLLVPVDRKLDELRYMVLARNHEPVAWLANVVHREAKVPFLPNGRRGVDEGFAVDKGHKMAHARICDGGLNEAQGRDEDGLRRHVRCAVRGLGL
jgi:hypothetical protein